MVLRLIVMPAAILLAVVSAFIGYVLGAYAIGAGLILMLRRDEPDTLVERAVAAFVGDIAQVPPMHSALKHAGRPLYDYGRAGVEVERALRDVDLFGSQQGAQARSMAIAQTIPI